MVGYKTNTSELRLIMDLTFSFDTSKWLFACGVSRRICVCKLCMHVM
jgi:hypothetical protein